MNFFSQTFDAAFRYNIFMKFVFCLGLFFIGLIFVSPAQAQEKIQSFDVNLVAHQNGEMTVEESITYDFGEDDRHGIYRDIPLVSKVGDLYRVIEIDFKEIKRDGRDEEFSVEKMPKTTQVKIGDPDKTITGSHNYIIIYNVKNGIGSNFPDFDEIYWNVTGNDWQIPIEKTSYKISTDFGVSPQTSVCYTGPISSKFQNCKADRDTVLSTQSFDAYQGLTVATKFPLDTFPDSELRTSEPTFDPDFTNLLKGYLPILLLLNLIGGPYLLFWYFKNHSKKRLGSPTVNFDIPKLSPAEVGIIDNTKLDRDDVIATIFDLAIRKYIKIEEIKVVKTFMPDDTDYKIVKLKNESGLNQFESKLYERLFRDGDEVKLKDLTKDFYTTFSSLEKKAFNMLVEKNLYTKNPKVQMGLLLVFGIIATVLGNIILGPIMIFLSRKLNGRTETGDQEDLQAEGLKIFLKAMSRHHKFQSKNLITVEKYIPYAIALGLQREFMEQLKIIDPNYNPGWYSGYHHNFYGSFANMNYSMNVSILTSAPSSSSGSSGGSSGGGGGGGGGGSW